MLVDSFLPRIAGELGLDVVAPLRGGEFGATIVRDREGQELVLKASPSTAQAPQFARGARLAGRLRSLGYPAPLYVATGASGDASWTLQERLSGSIPATMTALHAVRLIELARLHADAADRRRDWMRAAAPKMRGWARKLARRGDTGALASELAGAVTASEGIAVRRGDVMHNDFSHRNYLALGDRVTGVIDWELAEVGDWRIDLCSLAYDAALDPARVPDEVAALVMERARRACDAGALALFLAYQALRHLDYEARAHPERLQETIARIEAKVAPVWRRALRMRRLVA